MAPSTPLPFVADLLGWTRGKPNIADRGSVTSCAVAGSILETLGVTADVSQPGQTAGTALEDAVRDHLADALPSSWGTRSVAVIKGSVISDFDQYAHLATLKRLVEEDKTGTLRASIGSDYLFDRM